MSYFCGPQTRVAVLLLVETAHQKMWKLGSSEIYPKHLNVLLMKEVQEIRLNYVSFLLLQKNKNKNIPLCTCISHSAVLSGSIVSVCVEGSGKYKVLHTLTSIISIIIISNRGSLAECCVYDRSWTSFLSIEMKTKLFLWKGPELRNLLPNSPHSLQLTFRARNKVHLFPQTFIPWGLIWEEISQTWYGDVRMNVDVYVVLFFLYT